MGFPKESNQEQSAPIRLARCGAPQEAFAAHSHQVVTVQALEELGSCVYPLLQQQLALMQTFHECCHTNSCG